LGTIEAEARLNIRRREAGSPPMAESGRQSAGGAAWRRGRPAGRDSALQEAVCDAYMSDKQPEKVIDL